MKTRLFWKMCRMKCCMPFLKAAMHQLEFISVFKNSKWEHVSGWWGGYDHSITLPKLKQINTLTSFFCCDPSAFLISTNVCFCDWCNFNFQCSSIKVLTFQNPKKKYCYWNFYDFSHNIINPQTATIWRYYIFHTCN